MEGKKIKAKLYTYSYILFHVFFNGNSVAVLAYKNVYN